MPPRAAPNPIPFVVPPNGPDRGPRLLTPAGLWSALALAGIFAAVAAVPIAPADFWWHLQAGEQLLDGGGLVTTDTFSFTASGQPFMHQAWLAGAVLAAVYRVAGVEWLAVGNAALFTAGYGLVLLRCRDLTPSLRIAAAATVVAFAVSVENWTLRPQSFSVLLLPLVLLLVGRYADGRLPARRLAALPVIIAVWADLHGAFLLGIAAQATVAAALLLQRRPSRAWPLIMASGVSVLAACLNPWGAGIYGYLWTIATTPALRAFVLEWAPTDLTFLPGKVLAAVVALLMVRLAWARRMPQPHELALLLVFAAVALNAVRSVIWFGMVAAPVLVRSIPPGPPSLTTPPPPAPPAKGAGGIGRTALACILLMPLATTPWVRAALPLAPERRSVLTADTPVAAARALAGLPPGRRTFHDMQYGSYLIWAAPHQPVFIDPRIELYRFGQWVDYGTIAAGLNAAPLLDRYRIDTLLLDRQRQAGLLELAVSDPAWTQVYADQTAVMFRRTEEAAP